MKKMHHFRNELLAIFVLCLAACASGPVVENTGRDAWSMRINETWVPQARRAVTAFEHFSKAQFGESLKSPPEVFLTGKSEEAKSFLLTHPNAAVGTLEGGMSPTTLNERAVGDTVRTYMRAMQQQLTAGQQARIPHWLLLGAADAAALQVMEDFGTPTSMQTAYASATVSLRRSDKNMVAADEFFLASAALNNRVGIPAMSLLMIAQLKEQQGAGFWPAYARYLRHAARPDFEALAAFEKDFGVSRTEFLAQLEARLVAVRTEQRQHSMPIPEASGYARIDEADRFPAAGLRKNFELYRKAVNPKAMAVSPRGSAAYRSDDSDAMQKALAACKLMDELSCQLYAVDDQVVYRVAGAGSGGVEVVMATSDGGSWNTTVKEQWLPLTQRAVQQFNTLMLARTGTALNLNTRIYVTSSDADYERVLHEDLKMLKSRASDRASQSGGMSNGKGHIALILRQQHIFSPEILRERALKTPLHELTHELQSELSQGKNGRALVWIKEGTADLFGFSVAQALQIEGASDLSSASWQQKNKSWFNNGGWHVSAEDLWTADYSKWEHFMDQHKGPYQMAGLMAAHLETLMGDRFFEVWVAYYKKLADLSKPESLAFEESFGMTREAFLASFKASL